MDTKYMTVKLEGKLREKVVSLAKKERRSISDQAAYLVEKGLKILEKEMEAQSKAQKTA